MPDLISKNKRYKESMSATEVPENRKRKHSQAGVLENSVFLGAVLSRRTHSYRTTAGVPPLPGRPCSGRGRRWEKGRTRRGGSPGPRPGTCGVAGVRAASRQRIAHLLPGAGPAAQAQHGGGPFAHTVRCEGGAAGWREQEDAVLMSTPTETPTVVRGPPAVTERPLQTQDSVPRLQEALRVRGGGGGGHAPTHSNNLGFRAGTPETPVHENACPRPRRGCRPPLSGGLWGPT